MAKNLLKAGHSVTVFDVNPDPCNLLQKEGAVVAKTASDAGRNASCVITMLPNTPHVTDTILGTSGLLSVVAPGTVIIDSSTIDPNAVKQISKECAKRNVLMVDAPVSGGVVGAANGTLTFMIGAAESSEEFTKISAFLQPMGKNFVPCGGVGLGQVAKLSNNLALAIQMIGVSEALNLGIQMGMDPKVLSKIFNTSTARSWSSEIYNPVPGVIAGVPSSRNYEGGFGTDLIAKDLSLALKVAESVKAPVPLGANAHQIYSLISHQGYGKKDFSFVYEFFNKKH